MPEPLEILFRDAHFVAVHKPSGLLVHRTGQAAQATEFALQTVRDQVGQRVWPVHRLDRPTSGALLFALDRDALREASAMFARGEVRKTYRAVVRGWIHETGTVDAPLSREQGDPQAARTDFRPLATAELDISVGRYPTARYTLVELEPRTGRTHQLRRHMRKLRHPIVGDTTYGDSAHNRMWRAELNFDRLMLVALELSFTHPVSGEPVRIETTDPDFDRAGARLGWRAHAA